MKPVTSKNFLEKKSTIIVSKFIDPPALFQAFQFFARFSLHKHDQCRLFEPIAPGEKWERNFK